MKKLLTIAIPTYSRSRELRRALDAIACQYDERVEVLVSDDASPDDTELIVSEAQKNMPIRYIKNKENLGYDRNFLQCYKKATGKYVMLMGNDDFLLEGSVEHILDYLETNSNVDWVYVNFKKFKEIDNRIIFEDSYTPEINDRFNVSKTEFMKYASVWVSTLTSIVHREKALKIKCYAEYFDTFFLAVCIPLEITKDAGYRLGIIGQALIAYNCPLNEPIKDKYFRMFGTGLRYALCVIGPRCGYNIKIMRKAFKNGFLTWISKIISLRAERETYRRKLFWKDGFASVKDYPVAWLTVIPLGLLPRFLAVFMLKYIKPIYKYIKSLCNKVKRKVIKYKL